MSLVRLALYKRKRWWDIGAALIRWWKMTPYSHCELLVDGVCYSSSMRDGGVRAKEIEFKDGHWDFIDVPWVGSVQVKNFYAITKKTRYGWKDLILRQIFNKRGDSSGMFCSEWCAAALGIEHAYAFDPGLLAEYCERRLAE